MSASKDFKWEQITEYRDNISIRPDKKIEVKGIRNQDGFSVTYEHYERDHAWESEIFRCKGTFGEFQFCATHEYERQNRRMSRTASIHLLTGSDTTNLELCRQNAKHIEAALLEMSKTKLYHPDSTLEEVLFEIPSNGKWKQVQSNALNDLMFTRGFEEVEYSQRQKSDWKLITEKRTYRSSDYKDEYYDIIGIRRDDGFTMTLEGVDQNHTQVFLCTGSFGELKFSVNRWGNQYTNTANAWFLCRLYWFSSKWIGNPEGNALLCHQHQADIESALLNFPMFRTFQTSPIEAIEFIEKSPKTVVKLVVRSVE